jgi:hypothetical protein
MFCFQQGTNMETNKGGDWLGAITISNYEAMWQAHSGQVIDHMTGNKGKERNLSSGLSIAHSSMW